MNNEDCLNVVEIADKRTLFVVCVCDGMGGHSCGEVASQTVCDSFSAYWEEHFEQEDSKAKVLDAAKEVSKILDEKSGYYQMGTTLVMCSIEGKRATIAHAAAAAMSSTSRAMSNTELLTTSSPVPLVFPILTGLSSPIIQKTLCRMSRPWNFSHLTASCSVRTACIMPSMTRHYSTPCNALKMWSRWRRSIRLSAKRKQETTTQQSLLR